MTFKEWMQKNNYSLSDIDEQEAEFLMGEAWNYQQQRIDELEQWIAAIADDHKQIPDWIQQSARSLLAQEGE
jgi:replicative DNA helicase